MNYTELSDEEIIKHIRQDESYAMDELIERYKIQVKIKSRAYFLVGADEDDVIQEGMIGLYKAIRDFNEDKDALFKTFADLCINRQIITAVKTATRNKHTPLNNYISLDKQSVSEGENISIIDFLIDDNLQPEKLLIGKETVGSIKKSIQERLSEFEKKVIHLYLQGNKYFEIAEKLDSNEKAVDNALQRIKSKLKKFL